MIGLFTYGLAILLWIRLPVDSSLNHSSTLCLSAVSVQSAEDKSIVPRLCCLQSVHSLKSITHKEVHE